MRFLVFVLVSTALAGCLGEAESDLPVLGTNNGFPGITDWIGTEPLDFDSLQGSVVLVDFWTYSCENCIRTLPHLTSWDATYREHGLVIVGVHSPEFEFEKVRAHVEDSMDRYGIHYPVAQDNEFTTWRAWDQRYWPAKYLVDATGDVRYSHFGEGDYEETEQAIRVLLIEAGANDLPAPVEGDAGTGIRRSDVTPELYAGYGRQDWTLGNSEGYAPGASTNYSHDGQDLQRDRIYLDGTWHNDAEFLRSEGEATVWLQFRSGPVNFVADGTGCVGVYLDGAPIQKSHADDDVSFEGSEPCIMMDGPRAYHAYGGPVGTHTLELHVPDGFALYTFVFSSYDAGGPA